MTDNTTRMPKLGEEQSLMERPMSREIPNPPSRERSRPLASVTNTDERNGDHFTSRDMDWDEFPQPVCL
jgi:hypothetical protein